MKQPLQPAGQLLRAAANQSDDLVGTQKPVPVDEPDDFLVTLLSLIGATLATRWKRGSRGIPP